MFLPLLLLVGLGGLLYSGVLADVLKKLPWHVGPSDATSAGVGGACCGYDPGVAHEVLLRLGACGFAPPDPHDASLVEVVEGAPATPLASALGWAWGAAENHDVAALLGPGDEPLFLRAAGPGEGFPASFPEGYALLLVARRREPAALPASLLHRALAEIPHALRGPFLHLVLDAALPGAGTAYAIAEHLDAAGAPAAATVARSAAQQASFSGSCLPCSPVSPAEGGAPYLPFSPSCLSTVAAVRGTR